MGGVTALCYILYMHTSASLSLGLSSHTKVREDTITEAFRAGQWVGWSPLSSLWSEVPVLQLNKSEWVWRAGWGNWTVLSRTVPILYHEGSSSSGVLPQLGSFMFFWPFLHPKTSSSHVYSLMFIVILYARLSAGDSIWYGVCRNKHRRSVRTLG